MREISGAPSPELETSRASPARPREGATNAVRWLGVLPWLSVAVGLFLGGWAHGLEGWELPLGTLRHLVAADPARLALELGVRGAAQLGAVTALAGLVVLAIHPNQGRRPALARVVIPLPASVLVWLGVLAITRPLPPQLLTLGALACSMLVGLALIELARVAGARRTTALLLFSTLAVVDLGVRAWLGPRLPSVFGHTAEVLSLVGQTLALGVGAQAWLTEPGGRPAARGLWLIAASAVGVAVLAALMALAGGPEPSLRAALSLREFSGANAWPLAQPWTWLVTMWGLVFGGLLLTQRNDPLRATGTALVLMSQAELARPAGLLYWGLGVLALGLAAARAPRVRAAVDVANNAP